MKQATTLVGLGFCAYIVGRNVLRHVRYSDYQQALGEVLQENPFVPQISDSLELQLAKALIEIDDYGIPKGFYFLASLPIDKQTGKFIVHYRNEFPEDQLGSRYRPRRYEQLHANFLLGVMAYWGDHFLFREESIFTPNNLILKLAEYPSTDSPMRMERRLKYSLSNEDIQSINTIEVNANGKNFSDFAEYGGLYAQLAFAHEFGHVVGLNHTEIAAQNLREESVALQQLIEVALMSAVGEFEKGDTESIKGVFSRYIPPMDEINPAERLAFEMLRDFTLRACGRAIQICQMREYSIAR